MPPPANPSLRPSIRTVFATVIIAPLILLALTLGTLSWRASVRVSENLAQQAMTAASDSVVADVHHYLSAAVAASDRYTQLIARNTLGIPPNPNWERAMYVDLATLPSVASICYGLTDGTATWLLRGQNDRFELGRALKGVENGAIEYPVSPATGVIATTNPIRTYTYDPRQRPWYTIALSNDKPTWTPVYAWFSGKNAESVVGTGYTRKVFNADGQLDGVLVVDVTLGALNAFLARTDVAKTGRIAIIDDNNHLVASSFSRVLDESGNPVSFPAPAPNTDIEGAPARAHIAPFAPYPGIQWRIVAILPESAFLAEAHQIRRNTLLIGTAAVLLALGFAIAISRILSTPLLAVAAHVQRVANGDFAARLNLRRTREMAIVSNEINRMSEGLAQRMALEQSLAVAMEVQQSLLPAADPKSATLDIAGRSKYCDETGGDYYDFIDMAPITPDTMLFAVGDVMGHGIAAALLMATARAALLTVSYERPSLGQLLTRTNRVLATNNRHNRFMTLALLELNGATGHARWASAGHDPAIVYDPATDTFRELEGGEFPLGIMPEVDYTDYETPKDAPALPDHALLLIGTDGIWEMHAPNGDLYGKERMQEVIRQHHTLPAKDIATALESDLARFRSTRAPADDVTFVIIKRLPLSSPPSPAT